MADQNKNPEIQPPQNPQQISSQPVNTPQSQPQAVLLGQPVSNIPSANTQEPIVVHSQNDNYKLPSSRHWGLIITGVILLLLIVSAALYLYILPTTWSNSYIKSIKQPYEQQASKMTAVYQIFNHPPSAGSSTTTAEQGYSLINSTVATAISSNEALSAKNHLTVSPGTIWIHSVSLAKSEHQAMQQYIANSQTYLQDFKSLNTYSEQYVRVIQTQLPTFINDTNIVNKGAEAQTFITDLQTATTNLQNFINQLKELRPSADLQGYNQELISDLNAMGGALSAQESDLQANNVSDFANQKAIYTSAYQKIGTLLNTNPFANIRTSSIIHSQYVTLQAEYPLK